MTLKAIIPFREKPFDGVVSIATPHILKRFLNVGTPSSDFSNMGSLSYGKMVSST